MGPRARRVKGTAEYVALNQPCLPMARLYYSLASRLCHWVCTTNEQSSEAEPRQRAAQRQSHTVDGVPDIVRQLPNYSFPTAIDHPTQRGSHTV